MPTKGEIGCCHQIVRCHGILAKISPSAPITLLMSKSSRPHIYWRDVAKLAIGACIIGFPISVTEEVWNLGSELSFVRVLPFTIASVALLAAVIFVIHRKDGEPLSLEALLVRVVVTYSVTFLICALFLLGIDRLDLFQNPMAALNRTIIVAFPASFAATLVDSFADRLHDR